MCGRSTAAQGHCLNNSTSGWSWCSFLLRPPHIGALIESQLHCCYWPAAAVCAVLFQNNSSSRWGLVTSASCACHGWLIGGPHIFTFLQLQLRVPL